MNSTRLATIILICLPGCLYGQVNDAGLWTSLSVEKKITTRISIQFSEELRFNENMSELGTFFSELTGEYRFSKMVSVSGGYRFIRKRRVDDNYGSRHRYLVNVNFKRKFGRVNSNLRLRYQSQYAEYYSSDDGRVPENYSRLKLTLKYDTHKKLTPFVSGESFIHLNRADGMLCDNYRVAGGIEYEFSKFSRLELGYQFDREIQVKEPWTSYVILAGWSYVLK